MANVKVYSTPTCPWCTRAKNYLKSNNVQFEDIDVSTDREKAMEMVKKSGQQGVPVIEINGQIIIGFDQNKIDNLLGL
ncbi:MAG: glutaredoxin family protein [candidate division WOR-3 bacterium]|nr:glutaredoxin family protein [candidate division WOR-3 bacterium]